MGILANKRIMVGVTGGIAAYKACEIVRRLREQGALVKVVMSKGACAFVSPLSFQALSGQPVHTDLLDLAAEAAMGHIELARWAEAILVAPASADHMAKLAAGLADELITTLILASPAPIFLAPAMNQQMYAQTGTQANVLRLQQRGFILLGPASGDQACGDIGPGRMLEPNALVARLNQHFSRNSMLLGKNVLITAGPTREAIDPVRYLSNYSSGKMGYALAQAAYEAGAHVHLVSGPVSLAAPEGVRLSQVESAAQMYAEVMANVAQQDIFIACAAVADYRPDVIAPQKLKKKEDTLVLHCRKNPDILQEVSQRSQRPFCVGFAAETESIEAHAMEKLQRKKLDMLCANDVSLSGLGFGSDKNALTVFYADGQRRVLPAMDKLSLAHELMQYIAQAMPRHA